MKPYHVQPHPAEVILDANESYDALPAALKERFARIMAAVPLNRYPDMRAARLREATAAKEGCEAAELLFGNGSDELIVALTAAYCDPGTKILVPTPTFTMYRQNALPFGVETVGVPTDDGWRPDVAAMVAAIEREAPKIVFLATPNNPTGTLLAVDEIAAMAEASRDTLVVVDEAYADFADDGPLGKLHDRWPNVVVMKTLSKIGFAALRLGYLIGEETIVDEVDKVRQPFNVNAVTQAVATEAMARWKEIAPLFAEVRSERERMIGALAGVRRVTVFPSQANFLLMRVDADAEAAFMGLVKAGVRVRWFAGTDRLGDCFRVTVGTAEENDAFMHALQTVLAT
jgi:histidinol-phosphate aminotransferase